MDIQVYRCHAVFLLVPGILLPAHAAMKLHGPCHIEAHISLDKLEKLVGSAVIDQMFLYGFADITLQQGEALRVAFEPSQTAAQQESIQATSAAPA